MQIEEPLLSAIILVARLSLALVFLVSGIHKGLNFAESAVEFRDARVPLIGFFLPFTIALHLLASLAIIAGVFVLEGALALALFTAVATIKVHCFWRMTGRERLERSRVAMANLAVIGGLLLLAASGPGRLVL